jgi:hypothetical protein
MLEANKIAKQKRMEVKKLQKNKKFGSRQIYTGRRRAILMTIEKFNADYIGCALANHNLLRHHCYMFLSRQFPNTAIVLPLTSKIYLPCKPIPLPHPITSNVEKQFVCTNPFLYDMTNNQKNLFSLSTPNFKPGTIPASSDQHMDNELAIREN